MTCSTTDIFYFSFHFTITCIILPPHPLSLVNERREVCWNLWCCLFIMNYRTLRKHHWCSSEYLYTTIPSYRTMFGSICKVQCYLKRTFLFIFLRHAPPPFKWKPSKHWKSTSVIVTSIAFSNYLKIKTNMTNSHFWKGERNQLY